MIKFEWNQNKAKLNLRKHGVSFEEAESVFYDDFAMQFVDDTCVNEERFILLGVSNMSRILVVVHCERGKNEDILRIISARRATKKEQQHYRGDNS